MTAATGETPTTTTETVTPDATPAETAKTQPALTPEQLAEKLAGAEERIRQLNTENASRRKAAEELERQQAEAAQKAAEEQGRFKDLYEGEKTKATTATEQLTAAQERIGQYEAIIGPDLDARISNWPESVKKLIPAAAEGNALERFTAITALTPAANELLGKQAAPGMKPPPAAHNGGPVPDTKASQEQLKIAQRAMG